MKERIMNQNLENFAKLRAPMHIGGKEKVVHRTATADDKKLPFCLKKLGGNTTSGIKEVTMFTNQGTGDPVGQSCWEGMPVTDHADTEPLTETLPSLLKQLGAGGLTSSRRKAYALPTQPVDGKAPLAAGDQDDGDVPDHVQN